MASPIGQGGRGAEGFGAVCATHTTNPATAVCHRCGNFICGYCIRSGEDGEYFCPSCHRGGSARYSDLAWENPEEFGGLGAAFLHTLKTSLLDPNEFFKTVDPEGGYKGPILYILICYALSTLGSLASTAAQFASMPGPNPLAELYERTPEIALGIGAGVILLLPVWVVLGQAFLAALVHLACMAVGAAQAGFQGTFRLVSYAAGPQVINAGVSVLVALLGVWSPVLFAIVSMLGGLVQLGVAFYFYVLLVFGIRDVHGTTVGRAIGAIAALIGGVVLLSCGCVALWIAAMAGSM